jgi:hypothetical protein
MKSQLLAFLVPQKFNRQQWLMRRMGGDRKESVLATLIKGICRKSQMKFHVAADCQMSLLSR